MFTRCKEEGIKEEIIEENLNPLQGYVFTENKIYLIDFKKDSLHELQHFLKIRDAFISQDTIWIASDSLYWIKDKKIAANSILPPNYKKIVKRGKNIYVLKEEEILQLPNKMIIPLQYRAIKFDVRFGKIWILDEGGFSIYKEIDFKEEHRIPVDLPLDFTITNYGLRVYIITYNSLHILDTQTGKNITIIPIEDSPKSIKCVNDEVYCLTETRLYKIEKLTHTLEMLFQLNNGEALFFSRNKKYGIILRNSILSFWDLEKNEILKNIKLRVIDITTTPLASRIYCVTQEELIVLTFPNFQPISKLKLIGGKKVIIK
jgi:hypothetical protein